MITTVLNLAARGFVLAILGWCLYVAACIAWQAWLAAAALDVPEGEDDDEPVDETAKWDRARDRDLDYRAGVA